MIGQKKQTPLRVAGFARLHASARGISSPEWSQHDACTPPWQTYSPSTDPHCVTGILLARRRGLTVKPRQRQEVTP